MGERINKIKSNFKKDSVYIANIVDLDVFKYREKTSHKGFNFVSTGNLVDIKRILFRLSILFLNYNLDFNFLNSSVLETSL